MNQLQNYATNSITNPSAQLQPIYSAGLDQINQSYAGVPQSVTQQLASRGYGSSGLEGNSLVQVANAKAGSQSALSGQLAQDAVQQGQFGASLANALLNTGKGVSSTGTTSQTGSSSASGNSETTGNPSAFSDILGSLGALLSLGTGFGILSPGGGGSSASPTPNVTGPYTNPYLPPGWSPATPGFNGGSNPYYSTQQPSV